MEPITLTFDDAEQLYASIMSLAVDLVNVCGADVNDPRIKEMYERMDAQVRELYAYASPP